MILYKPFLKIRDYKFVVLTYKALQSLCDLGSSSDRVRSNGGCGIRPVNNAFGPFFFSVQSMEAQKQMFYVVAPSFWNMLALHFWKFGGNAIIFQTLDIRETLIAWFLVRISGEWLFLN